MMAQFRPCIDLHDGKVKQIVGSTLRDGVNEPDTNFCSNLPSEYYAELYRKYNLRGGHIIQLGKGNESAAESALRAWRNGFQLGGGVNLDNAKKWIDAGAEKVIVTSFVFCDGELKLDRLKSLVALIGKERLVLDLSCKKQDGVYWVTSDRWQKLTKLSISKDSLKFLSDYTSEFLVHAVDVEGKKQGVSEEVIKMLADFSPIVCTYAGGIKKMEDIELIDCVGKGKIDYTIGSALDIFGGELSFTEVLRYIGKIK